MVTEINDTNETKKDRLADDLLQMKSIIISLDQNLA